LVERRLPKPKVAGSRPVVRFVGKRGLFVEGAAPAGPPTYLDNPQRDGSVVRTRVVTYEELPTTSDNAKFLSITAQHPDARVSTNAAGAPTK
jgi:hypothetical protein